MACLAYTLNRAMPVDQMTQFVAMAQVTHRSLRKTAPAAPSADPRKVVSAYVRTKTSIAEVVPFMTPRGAVPNVF